MERPPPNPTKLSSLVNPPAFAKASAGSVRRRIDEGCPPKLQRRRVIKSDKIEMYIYIIQSIIHPQQTCVGLHRIYKKRIQAHNNGQSKHNSKFKPWNIDTDLWFSEETKPEDSNNTKDRVGQGFSKQTFLDKKLDIMQKTCSKPG